MRIGLSAKLCETLQAEMDNDESIVLLWGKLNRHNLREWCTENHVTLEHQRDSPKVNVYCAISRSQVYSPFSFTEET
jgi:hypothetical protein